MEEIKKKQRAEKMGAVTEFSERMSIITIKRYCEAIQFKNDRNECYLVRIDLMFMNDISFDDHEGKINKKKSKLDTLSISDLKYYASKKDIDIPLLMAFFSVLYDNFENLRKESIKIYFPSFMQKFGINGRGEGLQPLLNKISKFSELLGILPDGSIRKVLEFDSYDREIGILVINIPYMWQLMSNLTINPKRYKLLSVDRLMHCNMINERDKVAVQIVAYFLTVLRQRGERRVNKPKINDDDCNTEEVFIEVGMRVETIINKIPQFGDSIEGKKTKHQNEVYKRHFTKAYELLKTKTDAFQYYQNLSVTEIIPTVSRMKDIIYIKHSGRKKQS